MDATLVVIAAAAIAFGWWRVSVRRWPTTPCRRCGGTGRNPGSTSRRWGPCPKCGGNGRRKRYGAS
ncbi:MAG: hypothetical protein ACRDN0_04430 [Trebonia sp.]